MVQYEYKFVSLSLKRHLWRRRLLDDYQAIVHSHATDGWRLVQAFAPGVGIYGVAVQMDLIFERPVLP